MTTALDNAWLAFQAKCLKGTSSIGPDDPFQTTTATLRAIFMTGAVAGITMNRDVAIAAATAFMKEELANATWALPVSEDTP